MFELVVMAWRNLWRRPRRTVLTVGSFSAGLWAIIAFFAFMDGMDYGMIENAIRISSGHFKIYPKGYREEPELAKTISSPEAIERALDTIPAVRGYTGRVNADGLIASGDYSTGVWIIGVDPEREARVGKFPEMVVKGRFLSPGDRGVVLGVKLAESLGADTGSVVSVILQAGDGSLSAKNYPVRGLFSVGETTTDQTALLMDLREAQALTALDDELSEIVVLLTDSSYTDEAVKALVPKIDTARYEVVTWRKLIPFLVQLMKLAEAFKYVVLIVLIVVVFFAVLNTVLMSVTERTREFGIMLALGTKPRMIVSLVLTETTLLCLMGIIIGIPTGIGTVFITGKTGTDLSIWAEGLRALPFHPTVVYPFVNVESIFLSLVVVIVPGTIASLFPALRASRLTPVAAIRHS